MGRDPAARVSHRDLLSASPIVYVNEPCAGAVRGVDLQEGEEDREGGGGEEEREG